MFELNFLLNCTLHIDDTYGMNTEKHRLRWPIHGLHTDFAQIVSKFIGFLSVLTRNAHRSLNDELEWALRMSQ